MEINAHGVIPFARFMELALYCPDYGYYEKEDDSIGRGGDFYTSVCVGALFGELLAFQFAEWLTQVSDQRPQIVETGAHNGRLAADILTWLQQRRPELFTRVEYVICESSERRKQWQRATLREFARQVRWVADDLRRLPNQFSGVVFSNELLDALPVHRLGWDARQRKWFEWGVALEGEQFNWARLDLPQVSSSHSVIGLRFTKLPGELLDALPDGFTTEVCPAGEIWWRNAAAALRRGRLMTLDYGLSADDFFAPQRAAGTLRAYHRHRHCESLLTNAGEQDLTAHVNFSAIQSAGELAGLKTVSFTTQANYFAEIMKRFWPEVERPGLWTSGRGREFQTLVHPEHLGRAFRVLIQMR